MFYNMGSAGSWSITFSMLKAVIMQYGCVISTFFHKFMKNATLWTIFGALFISAFVCYIPRINYAKADSVFS